MNKSVVSSVELSVNILVLCKFGTITEALQVLLGLH